MKLDNIYLLHHIDFKYRKDKIENRLLEENVKVEWVENYLPDDIDYEKELINHEVFEDIDIIHPYGIYRNFSKKISINSLSLVLKHLWCYKDQLLNNYENVLILEDDVEIIPNFNDYLDNVMMEFNKLKTENDVEMVMLGTSHYFTAKKTENNFIYYNEHQKTRCTHAYILNISATKKIVEKFTIINLPIDFKLNEIIQITNIKVAWAEPGLKQIG